MSLPPSQIPVYRLKTPDYVAYRTMIAVQLSKHFGGTSQQWVEQLATVLNDTACWQVTVTPPQLEFRYRDRALAEWLQSLLHTVMPLPSPLPSPTAAYLPLQYFHSRCLSYLYLAQETGLITLTTPQKSLFWQWEKPHPVPWLQDEQHLCWLQSPSQALFSQLVTVIDQWAEPRPIPWDKVAMGLGETWETFERGACLWGICDRQLALAQAQFGLMAVLQRLLLRIFWEKWQMIPRLEF
ncbi:MAG: hypothetical protein F6K03_06465 [Kamptonema sp. SIO4C4]|nr:hypothetical protein [Kamptonema sp. SIO4C4]